MTMKLYYNPHSRAVVAKWMLDEAGADYEICLLYTSPSPRDS